MMSIPPPKMSDESPQCAICLDDFDEGIHPICHNRHAWCRDCLRGSVETAVRNVSDAACMPPRCCGQDVLPVDSTWIPREHPALRLLDPAALASWEEAVRRLRNITDVTAAPVDRALIRLATEFDKSENMSQFCPRCHRLITRSVGCAHMTCPCGQDFCLICGGEWRQAGEEDSNPPPFCHPLYGAEDEHVLRVPEEVETHLNEDVPFALADDTAEGVLCRHEEEFMHKLRLPRYLSAEQRGRVRCHVCGVPVRQFLMQCRGCGTEMCLNCRDELRGGQLEDNPATTTQSTSIGEGQDAG